MSPKEATPPIFKQGEAMDLIFCPKCGCHYSKMCSTHPTESYNVKNPPKKKN